MPGVPGVDFTLVILGTDGHYCRFNKKNVGEIVSGYQYVGVNNEEVLKSAVATRGPVAVSINAE